MYPDFEIEVYVFDSSFSKIVSKTTKIKRLHFFKGTLSNFGNTFIVIRFQQTQFLFIENLMVGTEKTKIINFQKIFIKAIFYYLIQGYFEFWRKSLI